MKIIIITLTSGLAWFGHAFLSTPLRPYASTTTRLRSTAKPDTIGKRGYDDSCDVLVLGSGPAGCAIASLLGSSGDLDVVVANKNFEADWVPNYGVWKDEWEKSNISVHIRQKHNLIKDSISFFKNIEDNI